MLQKGPGRFQELGLGQEGKPGWGPGGKGQVGGGTQGDGI